MWITRCTHTWSIIILFYFSYVCLFSIPMCISLLILFALNHFSYVYLFSIYVYIALLISSSLMGKSVCENEEIGAPVRVKTCTEDLLERNPPLGEVSYLLCSLIKNREEEDPPWRTTPKIDQCWGWFFKGGPLPPGSWLGNIVNKKETSPGGGGLFDQSEDMEWGGKCVLVLCRDVTSHKELWEGNGTSHSHNSDTVMGIGRAPGIFLWKENLPASAGNLSEKVFARIFDEFFRVQVSQKHLFFR